MIPSQNYDSRVKLFDEVFQSGVQPYQQNTALEVYRLVTGREFDEIKPYFATDKPLRGTYLGASGLFTTDKKDITSAEVLGNLGFQSAPSPSFLLHYKFSGEAVFLDRVQHGEFQQQFTHATGLSKHEFSQDCRYYLESHGMISDVQALAWNSVSGMKLGITGHTYVVLPPFSGALHYFDSFRLTAESDSACQFH
jgi:hypothetical protein